MASITKRETVEEIARYPGTAHVANMAEKALSGEISLDKALHETAIHADTFHAKRIAQEAIDKG